MVQIQTSGPYSNVGGKSETRHDFHGGLALAANGAVKKSCRFLQANLIVTALLPGEKDIGDLLLLCLTLPFLCTKEQKKHVVLPKNYQFVTDHP